MYCTYPYAYVYAVVVVVVVVVVLSMVYFLSLFHFPWENHLFLARSALVIDLSDMSTSTVHTVWFRAYTYVDPEHHGPRFWNS